MVYVWFSETSRDVRTSVIVLVDCQRSRCVLSAVSFQIVRLFRNSWNQHKQKEHSDLVQDLLISFRLIHLRICVESNLNTTQAGFDLRQDFFGNEMASFSPFCKGERLLPAHG